MTSAGTLLEIVGRVAVIYVALLVMLRVSGRRELSELSPMELLTMMLLSETVSPSITGGDETLVGGLTAAGTLILLSVLSSVLAFKSRFAERWIEGKSSVLIDMGRVNSRVLHEGITCFIDETLIGPMHWLWKRSLSGKIDEVR